MQCYPTSGLGYNINGNIVIVRHGFYPVWMTDNIGAQAANQDGHFAWRRINKDNSANDIFLSIRGYWEAPRATPPPTAPTFNIADIVAQVLAATTAAAAVAKETAYSLSSTRDKFHAAEPNKFNGTKKEKASPFLHRCYVRPTTLVLRSNRNRSNSDI